MPRAKYPRDRGPATTGWSPSQLYGDGPAYKVRIRIEYSRERREKGGLEFGL